jgi:Uma2 family endonuclease
MVATVAAEGYLTIDDLDAMNLPQDNWLRYELVDGELFVSSAPHWRHQHVGRLIVRTFDAWDPTEQHGLLLLAPGVIFTDADAVAPDLVWIGRDRLAEVLADDGRLRAAPDLIVEILSRGTENTRRDREIKLGQYSRYGVREYWIVDWRASLVDVFRHDGERLRLIGTLTGDDSLTSSLLPGFSARVGDLCASPV